MSLVISRQSWHYRLHMFIRKLWGWKPSPFEQWSLCPYFWTCVLGTLLSVIALIPALIGWLFAKTMRKAYKSGSKGGIFSWWAKLLDNSRFGRMLDGSADEFNNAFMLAGIAYLAMLLFCLIVLAAVGGLVTLLCYAIATGITNVPHYLWVAVLHLGYALFYVFAFVGIALAYAAFGVGVAAVWLYHAVIDGAIWLWDGACSIASSVWAKLTAADTWIGIGKWLLAIVTSVIVGVGALVVLALFAAYTLFNEKMWKWAEMKANGYAEARRARQAAEEARLAELEKKAEYWEERERRENEECAARRQRRDRNEKILEAILDYLEIAWKIVIFVPVVVGVAFWGVIVAIGIFLRNLYAKPVVKDGRRVKQLGPLGVLITMLFAFKKRACPLIEFADNSDLKDSPHPRPETPAAS